jgi:hypothetical protein
MRALLVVEGQSSERTAASIGSTLHARGYETRSQGPARTFDRDVQAADLLLVGFATQGLLRSRPPESIRSWIGRLPRLDSTPAAVFCAGRRDADHALAAVADALGERGAAILAVRVFAAAAPTDGVVPFTDAFLEAVADRRGA